MGEDAAAESHPGCSDLLSAWARPGNVREINNKYLGNKAELGWDGAEPCTGGGWRMLWLWQEPRALSGPCPQWGQCSEDTCHPEQVCAVSGVPACQHRSETVAAAWLGAVRHTVGTFGCCFSVCVFSLPRLANRIGEP